MEDFFARLKSATRTLHQEVEQTELAAAIMSPQVSTTTYIEYLYRSFMLHHTIEIEIFPQLKHLIPDLASRKKTDTIRKDLAYFTNEPPKEAASSPGMDYRDNTDFQLGLAYVTEGSTLGGLHILRHLRNALGPGIPGNFLNVYGDKTGTMWKSFLARLGNYQEGIAETRRQEIIAGALFGFERARNIFEKTPV